MKKSFTVDANSIISWGSESIKDSSTAVVELVKNSYDADATIVTVEIFLDPAIPYIRIRDNGSGMTENDIETKWLRIGYSEKRAAKLSALHRRKTGEKGIGRISADRLGSRLEIVTKTKKSQPFGLRVLWDEFRTKNTTVGDILLDEIDSSEVPPRQNVEPPTVSGTELTITGLRQEWTSTDILDLRDELSVLISPFKKTSNFHISLFTDIEGVDNGVIRSEFYTKAVLSLNAKYRTKTNDVQFTSTFQNGTQVKRTRIPVGQLWRKKTKSSDVSPSDTEQSLRCGDIDLKLYLYVLKLNPLLKIEVDITRTKKFLENNAGIRIYRDDVRVKPYGDLDEAGGDWLNLGKRKTANPAGAARFNFRVAPKQIVGAVFVSRDRNPELLDSTGREGLIHSDGFKDLQLLTLGCLQVLENRYHEAFVEEKEKVSIKDPVRSVKEINNSLNAFIREVGHITPMLARASEESVENLQTMAQELHFRISNAIPSLRNLTEQNIIYRGLATIGISSAVFGHETQTLIASFINSVDLLKLNLSRKVPDIEEAITECEEAIRIAESIGSWGAFALARVQRDKRRRKKVDVRKTITDLLDSLQPVFEGASVRITRKLKPVTANFFEMDIETILINLLTNAYNAVLQKNSNRVVDVSLEPYTEGGIKGIRFAVGDSGSGVAKEFRERIWEPLFTTKDATKRGRSGTGLGLSIVNSIVNDLGGTRSYETDSKLKGGEISGLASRSTINVMPAIGIIDDRTNERGKLVKGIEFSGELDEGWSVEDTDPFQDKSEYASWIAQYDIAVLLIDEKLNEKAADYEISADYMGHELIAYLRESLSPDFPMFIVTSFASDPELLEHRWELEGLIARGDFVRDVKQIVPKIIRAGQRYFDVHQTQLTEAEQLSKKVATGDATDDDKEKLDALRAYIAKPFQDAISDRREWIEEMDNKLKEFEQLENEFKSLMNDK